MDQLSIYKGKKVFLTGHTGFKGSWLLQWLHLLGAETKGYALAPLHKNDLYNLIDGDLLCHSVISDINDKELLEKAILSFEPDFIFHLAAQPLVRLSYEIPSQTFATNAIGTAFLLDAVRKLTRPCAVVLVTTDKVYKNEEWIYPYRENDTLGGHDPYSASKACAELIIQSYIDSYFQPGLYHQHGIGLASARAGNVIGGGDWSKDRIIPDTIKSLLDKEPVIVRNPLAVRPWQHVLEPLCGYLILGAQLVADAQRFGGAWNFGPLLNDNKPVEELVKMAIDVWGNGSYKLPEQKDQPHEATLLKLDISKAINLLSWSPKYDSKAAISNTIAWYKSFSQNPAGIKNFTIDQIKAYSAF